MRLQFQAKSVQNFLLLNKGCHTVSFSFRIVFGTWIVKMLCCELIKVYLALSGNRSKCIITNSDFYAGSTNAASTGTNVAEPVTFAKAQAG